MVSFRFHLVSLTAIFLALALGIAVGATVVNRGAVDAVERRLNGVQRNVDDTNRANEQLRATIEGYERFADDVDEVLVRGRLAGVAVMVVAVEGVDAAPLEDLRRAMEAAGADVRGTAVLRDKLGLATPEDAAELAAVPGVGPQDDAPALRATALGRLAEEWVDGRSTLPEALADAGFLDLDLAAPVAPTFAAAPATGLRFVVVSDATPGVPNEDLALPAVEALALSAGASVLAAEPGRDAEGERPSERAVFAGLVRNDADLADEVSTVDHLEDRRGRVAAVLALAQLGEDDVGHYGLGAGVDREVPDVDAAPALAARVRS